MISPANTLWRLGVQLRSKAYYSFVLPIVDPKQAATPILPERILEHRETLGFNLGNTEIAMVVLLP
jgi:hypothetical protein